VDENLID